MHLKMVKVENFLFYTHTHTHTHNLKMNEVESYAIIWKVKMEIVDEADHKK